MSKNRDFGVRPELHNDYQDMMKTVSKQAYFNVKPVPDSEFEKPYLTEDYPQQQQLHWDNFHPFLPPNMTLPEVSTEADALGSAVANAKMLVNGALMDFPEIDCGQSGVLYMDGYDFNGVPWNQTAITWDFLGSGYGTLEPTSEGLTAYVAPDCETCPTEKFVGQDSIQGFSPIGISNLMVNINGEAPLECPTVTITETGSEFDSAYYCSVADRIALGSWKDYSSNIAVNWSISGYGTLSNVTATSCRVTASGSCTGTATVTLSAVPQSNTCCDPTSKIVSVGQWAVIAQCYPDICNGWDCSANSRNQQPSTTCCSGAYKYTSYSMCVRTDYGDGSCPGQPCTCDNTCGAADPSSCVFEDGHTYAIGYFNQQREWKC